MDAQGLEVSWDKTWAGGGRVRGSLTLQDVTLASGSPAINSPRRLARMQALVPLTGGNRLAYEFRFDDRRRTYAGRETGGQAISDLRWSTTGWARGVELAVQVRNLFDKRYSLPAADTNWQDAIEQDGRSLRLSVQVGF